MSATGTPTPNLGLRIPLGTDPASVDDINYNSNALDTAIGDIGSTSVADQLGAYNSSLSSTQAGMAIVVNGNTAPRNITAGQYLFIKNHSSLSAGGYHATANIANGATITSSNVAADADGVVNGAFSALNSNITNLSEHKIGIVGTFTVAGGGSTSFTLPSDGVYLLAGYGSLIALQNGVFLIGGYVTASRCSVVNLSGIQAVSIDASNTSSLTFTATNSSSNNSIEFNIIKLK